MCITNFLNTFGKHFAIYAEADHQAAVRRQCEQLMEFQGKMKEACCKFESLEEEHLAQMSTFMLKLARVIIV